MLDVVGLVAGQGFAAGLNLYATALLLGLYGRWLAPDVVPEVLTSTPVLVVAGVLTGVEFVADKVPWLDSVWDMVHTVVRPVGAAVLASLLLDGQPLLEDAIAAVEGVGDGAVLGDAPGMLLAAVLAFVAHGAKASTRLAVNTSPEPVSNSVVSVVEDGVVAGVVYLAVTNPVVALAVVAVLAVLAVVAVVLLWRVVRSVRTRVRRTTIGERIRESRRGTT